MKTFNIAAQEYKEELFMYLLGILILHNPTLTDSALETSINPVFLRVASSGFISQVQGIYS